jgi:hypothetical protein
MVRVVRGGHFVLFILDFLKFLLQEFGLEFCIEVPRMQNYNLIIGVD